MSYVGKWNVEEPTVLKGLEGDEGLVMKSKAAHHAISSLFPEPIVPSLSKPLVVQYEVKLQHGLECGGAYIKLLTEESADTDGETEKGLRAGEEYTDKTPFTIMFGPDKCGSTNKVHFIFRHKNPITGEWEEKHLVNPPPPKITKTTALYTLIVNPDNTYEILINDESVKKGSLLTDFDPPVNPPSEIDDPADVKPADWVDVQQIPDMDAVKPADWDENAPPTIIDETATMPDDWLVDEPSMIPDPDAEKPEEWDDEEDGDWVPDMVSNPVCQEVSGCGPWEQPTIPNPAYKGKWIRPMIPNPAYKGPWAPRKIPNPAFFEDLHPSLFTPLGGIGFELWTMTDDILFDNIYVGDSPEDAKKFAKETFHVKYAIEKEEEGSLDEEEDESKLGLTDQMKLKAYQFANLFKENPMHALKAMPETAAALAAALFTLIGMLGALFGLVGSSKPTIQVKKATTVQTAVPGKPISDETAVAPVAPAGKEEKEALDKAGVETRATKRAGAGKTAD